MLLLKYFPSTVHIAGSEWEQSHSFTPPSVEIRKSDSSQVIHHFPFGASSLTCQPKNRLYVRLLGIQEIRAQDYMETDQDRDSQCIPTFDIQEEIVSAEVRSAGPTWHSLLNP